MDYFVPGFWIYLHLLNWKLVVVSYTSWLFNLVCLWEYPAVAIVSESDSYCAGSVVTIRLNLSASSAIITFSDNCVMNKLYCLRLDAPFLKGIKTHPAVFFSFVILYKDYIFSCAFLHHVICHFPFFAKHICVEVKIIIHLNCVNRRTFRCTRQ